MDGQPAQKVQEAAKREEAEDAGRAEPSLFLSNIRSITHKMDELELQMATMSFAQNCSSIFITETWLHPLIPDAAVEIAGRMLHWCNRNRDSGKCRGRGFCVYINKLCCNSSIIDTHYSPNLKVLAVSCRPFYLPREFIVVIVIAVLIPPDAYVSTALSLMLNTINSSSPTLTGLLLSPSTLTRCA